MLLEDLTAINRKVGSGRVINSSGIRFAETALKNTKNWQEQAAYVVRAVIADHAFEDGNKRTAAAYLAGLFEAYHMPYDPYKIDRLVLAIAKDSKSIDKIRRMIKNAMR
jgi:prophage maintenance system killer protein